MIAELQPYSEYKESRLPWCPALPAHWQTIPNRAVLTKRKSLVGKDHVKFQLLSLTKAGVIVRDISTGKGKFSSDMGTSQEVRPGDFVFCLFDVPETPRTVGLSKNRGMITSAYTLFEPRNLSPFGAQYLEQFYIAMDDRKLLSPLYSGLRNTIPPSRFLGTKSPLPPPDEQAAIVRFLDHANRKIDGFIRAKRKLIALLGEQKQAIIHRAVTRGLNPNTPLKPSGILGLGNIPKHWDVQPLKLLCSIQSGITLGKDYSGKPVEEYPYLRVANVQAGHAKLDLVKTIHVTRAEAQRSMLRAGDVLMTEGGDPDKLGRGCVWEAQIANCLHQNHVFAVRPNQKKLNPIFLTTLLAMVYARSYFQMTAKQTTNLAATNKTKIGMFKVLLPSVEEQARLLTVVDDEIRPLNTAIARTEREIALMQEYRTRLTADVVTGKLDVRAAAANLPDEPEELPAVDELETDDFGEDEDADE